MSESCFWGVGMDELANYYDEQLRRVFSGRKWILAMDVLVPMTGWVRRLSDYGAEGILCVAASRGTGAVPDPELSPDPIVFDVRGDDMMSGIRAALHKLDNLPADAIARVDAFDPDGTARVLGTIFDPGTPVAGREKYGARRREWMALEDKTVIDEVWDAIGVPRSPYRIVDATDLAGREAAARELDEGAGTVWVADNREGFHGGASFVRWARSEGDYAAIGAFLADHSDRIRITPFLDGLPCSIHGIVFQEYVVALRPCEMIVFRKPESSSFTYARAATFWDPPDADRESMREMVRRTGEHLRETVGYRGAFTIDGVMTVDGFRPTELNPRFGAALGSFAAAAEVPLMMMNLVIVEGADIDWRPEELEALLLEAADEHRNGSTMAVVSRPPPSEEEQANLVWADGAFRRAGEDEEADATVSYGPHAAGGFIYGRFVSERTPVGPSVAPRAAAILQWCDAEWDLAIGPLEPAPDVRRPA